VTHPFIAFAARHLNAKSHSPANLAFRATGGRPAFLDKMSEPRTLQTTPKIGGRAIDLRGQVFHRLTVLRLSERRLRGLVTWVCKCDCGQTKLATTHDLRITGIRSCGCYFREAVSNAQKVDLTGLRIGKITVLRCTGEKQGGKYLWECLCDCGTITLGASNNITRGHKKSCGCERGGKPTHGLSKYRWYKNFVNALREAGKKLRTPPWANLKAIRDIYKLCPRGHHVDHIIPLHGKLVSGLHVPHNLQYLEPRENSSKHARFEPQFIIPGGPQMLPNTYW